MSIRLTTPLLSALLFLGLLAEPSAANHGNDHGETGNNPTDTGVEVWARENAAPTHAAGPDDPCDDWALYSASDGYELPFPAGDGDAIFMNISPTGQVSVLYFRFCIDGWVYLWVPIGFDLEGLALEARSLLVPPLPEPQFAPPAATVRTIVGIDTWVWVPEAQWQPITATATAGATSITATATPILLNFDPGDDNPIITCEGPGVVWSEGAESECWHIYQWVSAHHDSGTWPATVEIEWDITWEASSGETGFLDPLFSEVEVPMTVEEIQIVVSSPSQPRG
jgi:hypothetical protein